MATPKTKTAAPQIMNPLVAMIENSPVMVDRHRESEIANCLTMAAQHPKIDEILAEGPMAAATEDGFWPAPDDWRASLRPYQVQNGILLIPVRGFLMHNFPWQLGNWATGYDYIWRAFDRGLADGNVRGIALVIHSPGGLVAGNQVLVDRMYARRGEKPIRAFAHETAASAAYNIFSTADHGVMSSTGIVGSIGTMMAHVDWSKWNESFGLKYTFIFAGAHKVDGNSEEPLSESTKARLQARVNELYDVFVSSVARNRGLDEKAVRATEALCFSANDALSNGLADSVGALDDALSAYADFLDGSSEDGDETMTTPATAPEQAAIDAAAAATATAEGATTERARISAILASEEAKGREGLAQHIAFNTAMSTDDAKAMLTASPVTAAAAPAAPVAKTAEELAAEAAAKGPTFEQAMDASGTPGVGANLGGGDGKPNADDPAATLALIAGAGVQGFRPATAN